MLASQPAITTALQTLQRDTPDLFVLSIYEWFAKNLHRVREPSLRHYVRAKAELSKGPLFRARLNSRSQKLGLAPIGAVTMYNLVQGYLARLPSSTREEEVTDEDGTVKKVKCCVYTPHSLRATMATLLLDAGVDIIKVKELLGHWHVTTTQIYDKRRRSLKEGASHDVPICPETSVMRGLT